MKVALLDLYAGTKNLGMDSIRDIIDRYPELDVTVYDVRQDCLVPDLSYDLYISSGGPGSPLEGDGVWDRAYFYFLRKLWMHNQRSEDKKPAFFICHSFQMVCNFLGVGNLILRHRPSYGVVKAHLTSAGVQDTVLGQLEEEFYVADFRSWQVVHPDEKRIEDLGAEILAIEKERPDVPFERALMAVRFSPEWLGVQFHPEAGPEGVRTWLDDPEKIKEILDKKGEEGLERMRRNVLDPDRLQHTYDTVLPQFIDAAINQHALNTLV